MNNVLEAYQSRPRRWWKTLLVTIIVAIILAWSGSSIEFEGIASKGSEVAYGIVHGIANPDLDLLVRHEEHRRSLPAAGDGGHRVSGHDLRRHTGRAVQLPRQRQHRAQARGVRGCAR